MRISLFWRTFMLLVILVVTSLALLMGVMRWLDRAPPEQRLAWEIASIANLTRSALISSQPERRLMLLRELARDEGVRVLPLETTDRIEAELRSERIRNLRGHLQALLGADTVVVLGSVNGIDGLWVSFDIDGDGYWLLMQRKRLERHFGPSLWLILGVSAGLSLLGALLLGRLVNQPLARLAGGLAALSRGEPAPHLREEFVVSEIAEVNRRFNQMASDLTALDADRSIALAGISHDIRSPLARLRMEVELAPLDDVQRASMVEDIGRIDRIVGQFIEFARAGESERSEAVDVTLLLEQLRTAYRQQIDTGALDLTVDAPRQLRWQGDPVDVQRAVGNLVDNALHYGRPAAGGAVRVMISARRGSGGIELVVEDDGPGIPRELREELLRPFGRIDRARGSDEGAGLGLAIVERLARRNGGHFELRNRPAGGLAAALTLPDQRRRPAPRTDATRTASSSLAEDAALHPGGGTVPGTPGPSGPSGPA